MTREEMKYLLKRFNYIQEAVKQEKPSIIITVGNRKERISIDENVVKLVSVVQQALELEPSEQVRLLMTESIVKGKNDIHVFGHFSITKSTFYRIKNEFTEKLFQLCIFHRLVLKNEIWNQ